MTTEALIGYPESSSSGVPLPVVAPRSAVYDPRILLETMSRVRPTIMQATPVTWRMLIDAQWAGDSSMSALSGGERLDAALARTLHSRVRELRKAKGRSQEAFAADCGLDRTYISGIERGERNPSLTNLLKLADTLGVALSAWAARAEQSEER